MVTGFGNGLLLPSLLTWALSSLGFEQRGRGTGVWTSAFFIGQFVCPLVVLALTGAIGGLGSALAVLGAVSLVAAAVVRASRPTQSVEPASPGTDTGPSTAPREIPRGRRRARPARNGTARPIMGMAPRGRT